MGNFLKSLSSVAILILLVFLCFSFAVSTTETNPEEGALETVPVEKQSATFCKENGGDYIEVKKHNDSKWGVCNFDDGSSCDADKFKLGKCRKGDSNNRNSAFEIKKVLSRECKTEMDCGMKEEFVKDTDCDYEMLCVENKCMLACPK